MRIAHIISEKDFSRLEALLTLFIKELKAVDIYSSLLVVTQGDVHVARVIKDGVDVTYVKKKAGFDFGLIGVLRHLASDQKADILHVHNVELGIYVGLAAVLGGKKAILTQHRTTDARLPKVIIKMFQAVVCSSESAKVTFLQQHSLAPARIKVIYNGWMIKPVDSARREENNARWREKLGIESGSFVIGNIGGFIKEEDQASIIKAFRKVHARNLNAHVVICGRGPLKESLIALAERYELNSRVRVIDVPANPDELFDMFSCFVLSCSVEGRSALILKAMAAGKPVITTNIGEYPEFVDERKSGVVVPCGFPERIDSAIMRLNAIKGLAEQFGQAGRLRLEEMFNIPKMVSSYKELYTKITH